MIIIRSMLRLDSIMVCVKPFDGSKMKQSTGASNSIFGLNYVRLNLILSLHRYKLLFWSKSNSK